QADQQLQRQAKPLPQLLLNAEVKDIFSFKADDISIHGYDPDPHIAAPIAV
ncbi:MAG: thymidylate synthase, partial [Candidatus Porifericomitaceae bacterium WSBS_2022_MAG_OTU9]